MHFQMIAFFFASVAIMQSALGCQQSEMIGAHSAFKTFSTWVVSRFQMITEMSCDPAHTYLLSMSGLKTALDQSQ